jgi:hypothetical protein
MLKRRCDVSLPLTSCLSSNRRRRHSKPGKPRRSLPSVRVPFSVLEKASIMSNARLVAASAALIVALTGSLMSSSHAANNSTQWCSLARKMFVGSKGDIAALRQALHGRQVDGVHVVGNYALAQWFTPQTDGTAVYQRTSGEHWSQLRLGAAGPLSMSDLLNLVPASDARQLCPG